MATKKSDEQFAQLLEEAKTNPNIIGFFLGGSRGKGFQNEQSDYDPHMIVKNEVVKTYHEKYESMVLEEIDLVVMSLSEFRDYALWGNPEAGDRYDFTHVKALVDKTGEVQKLTG